VTLVDRLGFAGVFALLVWTGSRRARGENEFLVADRSLGLFPLVATLVMTEFNTNTLLAFSAAGYRAGPMALALPFVFLVGLTFYTVTVAKAWRRFDRLSVAERFSVRYSTALGRLVSMLLLVAMTGFSATYVKSLTLLAQPSLPRAPFGVLSAALTATVLMVVLPGGLVSVVRSDVVSFLITLVILPVLLLAGFHWPRANAAGAWASVIVGVAWGVGSFLVVGESGGYTWPWAMYGIPLIFATGVIVSLAT